MFFYSSMFEDINLTASGTAVMCVILALMVIAAVAVNVVPRLVHKWEIEYKTRDLTYGAACLALGYALSWAGVKLPMGGTVTIAALTPIFLYCYYFGFRKGMVVVAAYTLLQFTQGVYIVSPWSAFFDYILPYFSLCVAGLFKYNPKTYAAFVKKNKEQSGIKGSAKYWLYTVGGHWGIFAGAAMHMIIRYLSNTISGVMFYELYYGAGASFGYKLGYSLSYNAYGLVDSCIAIAATAILLSSRAFNLYMSASFAARPTDEQFITTDAKTSANAQSATSSAQETAATVEQTAQPDSPDIAKISVLDKP